MTYLHFQILQESKATRKIEPTKTIYPRKHQRSDGVKLMRYGKITKKHHCLVCCELSLVAKSLQRLVCRSWLGLYTRLRYYCVWASYPKVRLAISETEYPAKKKKSIVKKNSIRSKKRDLRNIHVYYQ